MALRCNIDARGKLIRLLFGIALMVVGVTLALVWAWPGGTPLPWVVSLAATAGGVFGVFEARSGWCALRAMGLRTPF